MPPFRHLAPPQWRGFEFIRLIGESVCSDQTLPARGALVHRTIVRCAGGNVPGDSRLNPCVAAPWASGIEGVGSVSESVCIEQTMGARGVLVQWTIVPCAGGAACGPTSGSPTAALRSQASILCWDGEGPPPVAASMSKSADSHGIPGVPKRSRFAFGYETAIVDMPIKSE